MVLWGIYHRFNELCDFIRSFASGFIFTTALPPAVAAGARVDRAFENVEMERAKQRRQVAKLRAGWTKRAFHTWKIHHILFLL